jgi:hypothetical protein
MPVASDPLRVGHIRSFFDFLFAELIISRRIFVVCSKLIISHYSLEPISMDSFGSMRTYGASARRVNAAERSDAPDPLIFNIVSYGARLIRRFPWGLFWLAGRRAPRPVCL